jgi:hypothetical protein
MSEAHNELKDLASRIYALAVERLGTVEANKLWKSVPSALPTRRGKKKGRLTYNDAKLLELHHELGARYPFTPSGHIIRFLAEIYHESTGGKAGASVPAIQQRLRRRLKDQNRLIRRQIVAELATMTRDEIDAAVSRNRLFRLVVDNITNNPPD